MNRAILENQERRAWVEEEKHLEDTKNQISKHINSLTNQIYKLNTSFLNMIIDNEDRDQEHWNRNKFTNIEIKSNVWEMIKENPYYIRADIELTRGGKHSIETYYVGNTPIFTNGKQLVLDWRSNMGKFILKDTVSSEVDGTLCKKCLKRILYIQNGELKEFSDVLINDSEQTATVYIDPFLLRLIQEERNEHTTKAFIRTASQKQFSIISKPFEHNLIVQGCAGSGKTQIMLHRISYLLSNYPKLSLKNSRIISPSEIYNSFIQYDRETLSIGSVDCVTFEDYYIQLIRKYDQNYSIPKRVADERERFGESCSIVYLSRNIFKNRYNHYFENILRKLNVQKMNKIVIKANGGGISAHNYTRQTARNIIQTLEQVISTWNWKLKERENLVEKVQEAEKALDIRFENLKRTEAELKSAASQLKVWAKVEREILQTQLDTHTQYQKYRRQIQADSREISRMRRRINSINARLKEIPAYVSPFPEKTLKHYDTIINLCDPISKEIHASLSDLNSQINSLIEKYKTHNRAQYQDKIANFQLRYYKNFVDRAKAVYYGSIKLQNEKQYLLDRLAHTAKRDENLREKASTTISTLNKDKITQRLAIIKQIQQALNSSGYIDLTSAEFSIYNEALRKYNILYNDLKTKTNITQKTIDSMKNMRDKLKSPVIEGITDEEENYLRNCYQIAKSLEFDNILNYLMNDSIILGLKRQDKAYKTTCYRHKLYLRLLCCYLYYWQLLHGDAYLCVDEAQDAAMEEYDLLRNVLGPSCVFNLYGDIRQNMFHGCTIQNWSDLSLHKMEVLELDYNYRNTIEITEFCNKEFHMNVKPIGITGKPVTIKALDAAIREAVQFQKQDAKRTVAILHHYGEQPTSNMLYKSLDPAIMSWDKVEAGKIAILPVTNAKGLEFDLAVVVTPGMSENEMYIACTRAVEQLIVVQP